MDVLAEEFFSILGYLLQIVRPAPDFGTVTDKIQDLPPCLYSAQYIISSIISIATEFRCLNDDGTKLLEEAVEVVTILSTSLETTDDSSLELSEEISQIELILIDIYYTLHEDPGLNILSLEERLRILSKSLKSKGSENKEESLRGRRPPKQTLASKRSVRRSLMLNNAADFSINGGQFNNVGRDFIKICFSKNQGGQNRSAQPKLPLIARHKLIPGEELAKGPGFRFFAAEYKGRAVIVKTFEDNTAKKRRKADMDFYRGVVHSNVLTITGASEGSASLLFIVFDGEYHKRAEYLIVKSLREGVKEGTLVGLKVVSGISAGLSYLEIKGLPSMRPEHFSIFVNGDGRVMLAFDVGSCENRDKEAADSQMDNPLRILDALCQQTFDAACRTHYDSGNIQRGYEVEDAISNIRNTNLKKSTFSFNASSNVRIDREATVVGKMEGQSMPRVESGQENTSQTTKLEIAPLSRRQLVWQSSGCTANLTLQMIAEQFQCFLEDQFGDAALQRRCRRYITGAVHRCPGYSREEITLSSDISKVVIISHLTPVPHEICPMCGETVNDADVFSCVCGHPDNELEPTIKCSTCLTWQHRGCVGFIANPTQFQCSDCTIMNNSEDVIPVIADNGPDTMSRTEILAQTLFHDQLCRGSQAVELQIQGLDARKSPEHPDTLLSMENLAETYNNQGQWKEAEELQIQVIERRKRMLGAEHPDTLSSMANLAVIYWKQGQWKEAEELQIQVMERRKRVLGTKHPDTLSGIANLARTYNNLGQLKEAEELEIQVLELSQRILGPDHPDLVSSMANLAGIYSEQGQWKEAEELQIQVIERRKRVLSAEHPDTLLSMANLAGTYNNLGQLKEAEELEIQVLELSQRILGPEHPYSMSSMANLAGIYSEQGQWKEAEELQIQVIETKKRVLSAENPDTLSGMANLAGIYWKQGRWKEAEELQIQVIERRKRMLGAEHPDTLSSMANLAEIYWEQGQWKEAEELQIQVIERRKRVLGAEHPDTLSGIANLARAYNNLGWLKEAEELEIQVLELRQRILGPDHPDSVSSLGNLAAVYRNQGQLKEAEELEIQVPELK